MIPYVRDQFWFLESNVASTRPMGMAGPLLGRPVGIEVLDEVERERVELVAHGGSEWQICSLDDGPSEHADGDSDEERLLLFHYPTTLSICLIRKPLSFSAPF